MFAPRERALHVNKGSDDVQRLGFGRNRSLHNHRHDAGAMITSARLSLKNAQDVVNLCSRATRFASIRSQLNRIYLPIECSLRRTAQARPQRGPARQFATPVYRFKRELNDRGLLVNPI
jgi:hypothetical protein